MAKNSGSGQSGGVNISGKVGNVGGDIVGGNKISTQIAGSTVTVGQALQSVAAAIAAAPPEKQAEAQAKLTELTQEAEKGEDANDGVIARLVKGLVGLVPSAASAVVSAFGTPILGALTGPVTEFVLEELKAV